MALLAACVRPAPDPAELRIGIESAPQSLDPRLGTDAASARLGQLLHAGLLRTTATGDLAGDLALAWDSPDPLTLVFRLRPEARFHDGRPVTARDVAYTYRSLLDPQFASPKRAALDALAAVEPAGEHTVVFRLARPFAPLAEGLTVGILPEPAGGGAGAAPGPDPIGAGPFRLVRREGDDRFLFERFADYYGGPPPLARILVRVVPDATMRLLELEGGGLDLVTSGVPLSSVARLRGQPELQVLTGPGTNYFYLGFNLRDPVLGARAVRRAIAVAIDRPALLAGLWAGLGRLAAGLLPPEHWAFAGDVPTYSHDPDLARRLLDEAGFPDPDGAGPAARLALTFKCSENKRSRRLAEALQAQLGAVGIALEIRSFEWGTFYGDVLRGDFQLYALTWVGVRDPDIYYSIFHSSQVPPAGRNRGALAVPALDRLLEQARLAPDRTRRRALYAEVQRAAAVELPYVSLWFEDQVVVLRRGFAGFEVSPDGSWETLARLRPVPEARP